MGLKDGFGLNGGGSGGGGGLPYKSYVATITQDGSAAPVATVLQNDTGLTFSYGRVNDGQYYIAVSGGTLTLAKTFFMVQAYSAESGCLAIPGYSDPTTTRLYFQSLDPTLTPNDGLFDFPSPLEIRIYP